MKLLEEHKITLCPNCADEMYWDQKNFFVRCPRGCATFLYERNPIQFRFPRVKKLKKKTFLEKLLGGLII